MSIFYQRCNASFPKKIDISMPPEDLAQLRSPPANSKHAYRRAGDGSGAVFVDDRSSFFNSSTGPVMQVMVEAYASAKQQWKQECPCISQMIDTIPMTISKHLQPNGNAREGVVAFVAPWKPLEISTLDKVLQDFVDVGLTNDFLRNHYHSTFYHELAHIFGSCIPCWDATKIERFKALREITKAKEYIAIQIKAATFPSRYVDNMFREYMRREISNMFPTIEQKHKEFWELYNSDPDKYPQVAENEDYKKRLGEAMDEESVAIFDRSTFSGRLNDMKELIPLKIRNSPRDIANYLIGSILNITSDQDDHTLIYLRQFLCNNNGAKSFIASTLKHLLDKAGPVTPFGIIKYASLQDYIDGEIEELFGDLENLTTDTATRIYYPLSDGWPIMFNPDLPPSLREDDVVRMLNEGTWLPALQVARNNMKRFYERILSFDSLEEYMFEPLAEIFDNIFKNTPFDKSKICSFFDNIYTCDNLQPELRLQFDLQFKETKGTIWNGPTEWDILARPQSGSNSMGCCAEEKTWERWLFGPPDYGYFKIGELVLCESCPGKCSFMWRPPQLFDREAKPYRRNILSNSFISSIIFGCTLSKKVKGGSGPNNLLFEDSSDYGYNQDIINKLQDQLTNEVFQAMKASLTAVNAYLTVGVECDELKGKKADYGEL